MLLDENYQNELESNPGSGEKLIWTGKPKRGIVFRLGDIILVPFSLLWLIPLLSVLNFPLKSPLVLIIYMPFMLVGFYLIIGRFFLDSKMRANTTYGITKDRIIISRGIFSKSITSLYIKGLSEITIKKGVHNTGTILLGPSDFRSLLYEGNPWPGRKITPRLEFINDAKTVYEKILELQRS